MQEIQTQLHPPDPLGIDPDDLADLERAIRLGFPVLTYRGEDIIVRRASPRGQPHLTFTWVRRWCEVDSMLESMLDRIEDYKVDEEGEIWAAPKPECMAEIEAAIEAGEREFKHAGEDVLIVDHLGGWSYVWQRTQEITKPMLVEILGDIVASHRLKQALMIETRVARLWSVVP